MIAKNEFERNNALEWIKENYVGKEVTSSKSPAGNWLGFTMEHIEKGAATLLVTVRRDMTNPYGNIHGGMMALVVDEAIGWAVVSLGTQNYYTSMSLNVDFLYAITEGDKLRAKSKVIRQGKKIICAECFVYDMQGNILARGNSNLIVTQMEFTS